MSDKVFDLVAGGFAQGRDAAKIHGVGLHQIRVKLMLADDLAQTIADLGPAVVSISRLRRKFARVLLGSCRHANGSDFLDRADADAIRLSQSSINGAGFGHPHFGTVHQRRDIGGIGIAVPDKSFARPRSEYCGLKGPALCSRIAKGGYWLNVNTGAVAHPSETQKPCVSYIPAALKEE